MRARMVTAYAVVAKSDPVSTSPTRMIRPVMVARRTGGDGSRRGASSEVSGHQFVGPGRLAGLATRPELDHIGLDVQDRRPVDGVQAAHVDRRLGDAQQLATRQADPVGPELGSLREDPDFGPVGVAAWASGARAGRVGFDLVEEVDDLDVAELTESEK